MHALSRQWAREGRDVLVLRLAAAPLPPAGFDRLANEYGLKDHLEVHGRPGRWSSFAIAITQF